MLKLDIYNKTKTRISTKSFYELLRYAEKTLIQEKIISGNSLFAAELTFVGNALIKKINKKYRRQNKPTDVISLSYFKKGTHGFFAGEIFISAPFARKQAEKMKHSFQRELHFLFIHGLLHVFGFDHKTSYGEAKMDRLTQEILPIGRRKS